MNTPPIVRFAPSPTGRLHIGNARTALLNWLFAKQTRRQVHPALRRYRPGVLDRGRGPGAQGAPAADRPRAVKRLHGEIA
jgi:hypothetical protein